MTTPSKAPSLLHPAPWLSALLLVVATGTAAWLAQLIARGAVAIGIESPRLVALVGVVVLVCPIALVALAHHTTAHLLDRASGEKTSGTMPGITSWWAGMFAWLTAMLVSTVLFFAAGVVNSGGVLESVGLVFARSSLSDLLSWPVLAWVGGAGLLYTFERQAKHRFATAKTAAAEPSWKFYAASFARAAVLTMFLAELAVGAMVVAVMAVAAAERESHTMAALLGATVVISPIVFVALGDHAVRHVLRLFGVGAKEGLGKWPSLHSWWTGLFSWFVLAFGGVATFAVHGVLFGASGRVTPTAAFQPLDSTTLTFIGIATALFLVEASMRRRLATRGD